VEQIDRLSSFLKKSSEEIGVALQTDQVGQFMLYLEQLQTWNRSVNLTSITIDEEIIVKHFVDSLAGLKAEEIGHGARLLDVGTGAGFPGIPLRIVRQDLNVTLIEPAQNRISFLHSIVGLLRLDKVKIFHGTLERFLIGQTPDRIFDYVTTRALKYDFLLRNSGKLLSRQGKVILYLSQPINRQELGTEWSVSNEHAFDLPLKIGKRVISVLSMAHGQTT
jgi:16S rRNA (guanine527-N7)-methyltransferase